MGVREIVSLKYLKIVELIFYKTINVEEILKDEKVSAKDPFRLDNESEQCVEIIKKELNKIVTE